MTAFEMFVLCGVIPAGVAIVVSVINHYFQTRWLATMWEREKKQRLELWEHHVKSIASS